MKYEAHEWLMNDASWDSKTQLTSHPTAEKSNTMTIKTKGNLTANPTWRKRCHQPLSCHEHQGLQHGHAPSGETPDVACDSTLF